MAEHISNALTIGGNLFNSAISHLPQPAQEFLQTPLAQKTLLALLALKVVHSANSSLSHWTLNNWSGSRTWNPAKELVLVSGGCMGIGKQVMLDLAKTGAKVVIVDLIKPDFTLPTNVFYYTADVTSTASIKAVADKIRSEHGDPTAIVNNAGVGYDGTILEETEEKIQRTFQVNTVSHFWMVREFLPAMIKNDHGHVITVASMASFLALGEMVDYCCSKASALAFHEGLTQELRLWHKTKGVRTSVIHPQWVRTAMIQQLSDAGTAFKMPIMGPEVVSRAIVKQIVTHQSGQVILPTRMTGLSYLRAAPGWLQEVGRGVGSGMLKSLRDQDLLFKKDV